jgi:hypothetical protein
MGGSLICGHTTLLFSTEWKYQILTVSLASGCDCRQLREADVGGSLMAAMRQCPADATVQAACAQLTALLASDPNENRWDCRPGFRLAIGLGLLP